MRFGMCNELYEGWEFADVCRSLKSIGYEGIEIAPFTLANNIIDISTAKRAELKRIIADEGLQTIGLHWLLAKTEGFYLTSPDRATRTRTADYLKALAEATQDLGGELMVLGSPKQRDLLPGVSYADAVGYAIEVFEAIALTLEATEVDLCLEPLAPSETNFLNTCDQANALLARLNHPRFQLHMDVKAQSGEVGTTVPALIALHAQGARHFHAQDTNLKGPGMGSVDFGPIMKSLVLVDYDHWVSVEVFDYSPGAIATATESLACLKRELSAALA